MWTFRSDFDLDAACRLYGLDSDQLIARFAASPPIGHWIAYDAAGTPVGVLIAAERPDRRVFLTDRVGSDDVVRPLLELGLDALDGPVHVTVRAEQTERLAVVAGLGLLPELTSIGYDVPFEPLLTSLPSPRDVDTHRLVPASEVDPDELFALDTALRNDVPGNDGWIGNRQWFDDELRSPEFDPGGYAVAVDTASDDLIGLCRMWRNPDGPTLGMLGVRRDRRHGFVASSLLRAVTGESSRWGWPSFTTHTARVGLQRRLDRLGAARSGGFVRFVRP